MHPVLEKLQFRGQSPILWLRSPEEFGPVAAEFGADVHTAPKGRYSFTLAFARSMAEAEALGAEIGTALEPGAVVWLAYPTGTSKKNKKPDLHRDTLHARMADFGLEGVSLVGIDADWSAMRFKLP